MCKYREIKLLMFAWNRMHVIKSSCSDTSNTPEIQSKEMLVNILTMPGRILDKYAHLGRKLS
jgi:hypothetical protein